MALADELPWLTLDEVTRAAQEFLNPVLSGDRIGRWNATAWGWESP